MDNTNDMQASGEQPANHDQHQVNENSGAQPSDVDTLIAGMSQEALLAILDGGDLPPAPANVTNPTDTHSGAHGDPSGEQPTEGDPQAEQDPASGDSTTRSLQRLSVRGLPADQQTLLADAIKAVRNGEFGDIPTAIQSLSGISFGSDSEIHAQSDNGPDDQAPTDTSAPAESTPSAISEIETQIEQLEEERIRLLDLFENRQAGEVEKQIRKLTNQLWEAKIAKVEMDKRVSEYQSVHQSSIEEVESKYEAWLDNPDSGFSEMLDALVTKAKVNNDPQLSDPRFIVRFADKVAGMLGVAGNQPQRPATPTAAPRPPVRASRPVGSTMAPGSSNAPRYTPDQIKQMIDQAPADVLFAILDS